MYPFVCRVYAIHPSQQFFSHVGAYPVMNSTYVKKRKKAINRELTNHYFTSSFDYSKILKTSNLPAKIGLPTRPTVPLLINPFQTNGGFQKATYKK